MRMVQMNKSDHSKNFHWQDYGATGTFTHRHTLFYCTSLHLADSGFHKFHGNSASNKSVCAIFPTAFAHSMSLCHILAILKLFQTFPFFFLFIAAPAACGSFQARGQHRAAAEANATATATLDPSRMCNLYHSLWQHQILSPGSEARDWTHSLSETMLGSWPAEPQWELPLVLNLLRGSVISDLWCYYYDLLKPQMMVSIFQQTIFFFFFLPFLGPFPRHMEVSRLEI